MSVSKALALTIHNGIRWPHLISVCAALLVSFSSVPPLHAQEHSMTDAQVPARLVKKVQDATRKYFNVNDARKAGYGPFLGCVTGPGAAVSEEELAAAAADAGLAAPACLTAKALSPVEGHRCARSILTAGTACTAIVTTSDLLAAGCCRAIGEAGLACPQDMSVTGLGDLPLAGCLHPALTTLRLPQYRVGTAAAELLLRRITRPPESARTVLMEPKLVTRTSSGPPPSGRCP